jgi:hypothetical protein
MRLFPQFSARHASSKLRRLFRFAPHMERLEDRTVPAAHIVGDATVYPTISAAVAAASPGATINVDPGVYNETVTINKPLTLDGAQAGADASTRSGSNESVVQGPNGQTAFVVAANDVTINGFTVQGNTSVNQFGAGIYIQPGESGTQIRDNIVQDNIVGLFLSNSSATDQAVVANNLFRDNTQPGAASGTDIYADQFTAGSGMQNVLIENNTFTNSTFVENTWGIGISNTDGTHPFTNLQILNNTFNNTGRDLYFFDTTNSVVSGNTFTGATHYAIGILGGDSGLTIDSNNIEHNGTGILVEDDLGGSPSSNVQVHFNNIVGNTHGIVVQPGGYTGTLNAESNWWGSPSGPSGAGPGTGDSVSTGVDFANWLRSPAGSTFQLIPNPVSPGNFALVINGTSGNDHIVVEREGKSGNIAVETKGERSEQVFNPASLGVNLVVINGLDGNDHIQVAKDVMLSAIIFGGNGNDHIQAGGGPTLIEGGAGNDKIEGGSGSDILIGGIGNDHIEAGRGNTILIGGTTDFDSNLASLAAILNEWQSQGTYSMLTASTVHDDGGHDNLDGGPGTDVFFAGAHDKVHDVHKGHGSQVINPQGNNSQGNNSDKGNGHHD